MTDAGWTCDGATLYPGNAHGVLLVLGAPLSFWGGVDRGTGRVIDVRHPQHGLSLAGKVVALRSGRGSSSSSSVLAEMIRAGCGPAALLLAAVDAITVLGAMVAGELYGKQCPVVRLDERDFATLATGRSVEVAAPNSRARLRVRPQASADKR